jgi:hypothetical protein
MPPVPNNPFTTNDQMYRPG